jgi:hypothetical protein
VEHPLTPRCAVLLSLLAAATPGCGGSEPRCSEQEIADASDRSCLNAHVLAARYTSGIRPPSAEIDGVLSTYASALRSRGDLCFIRAKMWWSEVNRVEFDIAEPAVANAWEQGELRTGVAQLDSVLDAAGAKEVTPIASTTGAFLVIFRYAVNAENLERAIGVLPGVDPRVVRYTYDEGEEILLEPGVSGTTDVVFRYGWGDCNVQCDGNHWWRIRVTTDGAELIEEWGAPIPDAEVPRMQTRVMNECMSS